jgi:23S rRNA pseudouridine1911/1915/1917 synthase
MTEPEQIEFTVTTPGERLDKLIVAHIGERLTRSQVQALIHEGSVTVNGAQIKPGVKLKGGEMIRLTIPPPPENTIVEAEPITLSILYEDADFAVIDKPAGLIVHPGAGGETGTLVHALLSRYPEIETMPYDPKRRGIVHRLDKDTSGLIIVARNAVAMNRLMKQFQQRSVEKLYLALSDRAPRTRIGRIDAPIGRDPHDRKKMAVQRGGKPAVSEFEIAEQFDNGAALVRVKLLTGRTHQIRVHLAFIDAPIVGDRLYGSRRGRVKLRRQFLHAAHLCFDHPRTGERLCFESPLPPDLQAVIDELRGSPPLPVTD